MTVAVAYARFSSDAQREESIEIQLRECERLAKREGWELSKVYTDYAKSGRSDDGRDGFKAMLADGEDGRFDVLVIYKLDRFARNVVLSQASRARLFRAGVRIFSVREGEIVDTPDGFLVAGVNELFAEYFSRNLSVMVSNGMAESARKLLPTGRFPYGYWKDRAGNYVIVEEQAEVVRTIFEMFVGGKTANQICDHLNSKGIPTPRNKSEWYPRTVVNLLNHESYMGYYKFDGTEREDGMPAIVSKETWHKAQEIRAYRSKSRRRRRVNDYLLTDKIWCLNCGMPLCGASGTSGTGKKYTYYKCANRGGCQRAVPSGKVERAVSSVVRAMLRDGHAIDDAAEAVELYGRSLPDDTQGMRDEIAALQQKCDNLYKAIEDGMPWEKGHDMISKNEARIATLRAQVEADELGREEIYNAANIRAFVEEKLQNLHDPESDRILIETFVNRIYTNKLCAIVLFTPATVGCEPSLEDLQDMAEEYLADKKSANPQVDGEFALIKFGSPYQIRTGDLRLERAAS